MAIMNNLDNPVITIDNDISTNNIFGHPYNVILFNDSVHDMFEVSTQIQKAINCSADRAVSIMIEAHTNGHAIVFTGSRERCEHVDSILSGPPTRLSTAIQSC